eukprot:CAMPEP_0177693946 /NCGR_PEP_ID=MMETSP0484_2-20121128/2672_1 /TAXON_ID=354590 /ORGANISM="Rhodomonas lens, Strain RHODO" /LENGTH=400 /DNA_ID=CAMNT_0019204793 /DNA_START=57 /DNA_END=1259 /DNA_ORIENTATION=+
MSRGDSAVTIEAEVSPASPLPRSPEDGCSSLHCLALLSVVLYTANGEILQAATTENVPGAKCSPMLLMTLCHSSAILVVPWFAMMRKREDLEKVAELLAPGGSSAVIPLIVVLSLVLLLPNYLWTKSISYQPVGTTNAILQTSVGFAYVGSQLCLHGASAVGEGFTAGKTCAVFLAIAGSFIGLLEPSDSGSMKAHPPTASAAAVGGLATSTNGAAPMLGASLALASSATQAAYMIFSKRTLFAVRDKLESLALVWAGIATVHVTLLLPFVLFLLPMVGGEKAEFPDVYAQPLAFAAVLASIVLAGMVNTINTVVGVRGSPVLLSMAYTLVLPLSRLADWRLHGIPWTVPQAGGDVLILASFLIMSGVGAPAACRKVPEQGVGEELVRLQSVPKDGPKGA